MIIQSWSKALSLQWKQDIGITLFAFVFVAVAVTCFSIYLGQLNEGLLSASSQGLEAVDETLRYALSQIK